MATQDFSKLYYRTANCLTSDIIADFSPVSRVLGADTSTGMGVVFTAMGTRFDMQYAAKEAFMAADSYESDTRSIDDTPVAEVMRYVRSEIIAGGNVPEAYQALTEKIRKGECVYGQYAEYESGCEEADVLFLISPAEADAEKTAEKFTEFAGRLNKSCCCTNKYKDCGYLLLQLGQTEAANAQAEAMAGILGKYKEIVTDDGYVLDTLLIQFPELSERIRFIDEFIYEGKETIKEAKETIVLHESGIIQRLYPSRSVDYRELFADGKVILPVRSGFDVTDSGLAGGLGLYEPENLTAISGRRMADLTEPEHDVIITPCACEAAGLNCAEKERVMTLLEYVCHDTERP